jgi:hypothetical protein
MVWKYLERIACLLKDLERQSVLGDIQERGASFHSLLDLTALVALRQLQAWKSSDTWILAALLALPAYAVVNGARVIVDTASHYPWPDVIQSRSYFLSVVLRNSIATLVLAWTTGFSLALLARRRTIALLVPVALFLGWLQRGTLPGTLAAAASLTIVVGIPGLLGLMRGWQGVPLSSKSTVWLVILCIPFLAVVPDLSRWLDWCLTIAAFWPAFYAVTPSRLKQVPR